MASFSADARGALARALAEGGPIECPACGGAVSRRAVAPPPEVSYVRHRVWLVCAGCGRGGAIDLPADSSGGRF